MTSVTRPLTLHALAGADLDARSATEAIRCALNESARSGEAIYIALQTWTWKALTERRYDEELRAWHQLFEKTIAVLAATRQRQAATKIETLRDLVYQSIQFGEHEPVEQVLQRAHVRTVLQTLRLHGVAARVILARATGLRDANLSRVLSVVQSAGLVEREQRGKEAAFTLSRRGRQACAKWPAPKRAAVVPPPPARLSPSVAVQMGKMSPEARSRLAQAVAELMRHGVERDVAESGRLRERDVPQLPIKTVVGVRKAAAIAAVYERARIRNKQERLAVLPSGNLTVSVAGVSGGKGKLRPLGLEISVQAGEVMRGMRPGLALVKGPTSAERPPVFVHNGYQARDTAPRQQLQGA